MIDVSPVEDPVNDIEPANDFVYDEEEEEDEEELADYAPVGDVVDEEQAGPLPVKGIEHDGSSKR